MYGSSGGDSDSDVGIQAGVRSSGIGSGDW